MKKARLVIYLQSKKVQLESEEGNMWMSEDYVLDKHNNECISVKLMHELGYLANNGYRIEIKAKDE